MHMEMLLLIFSNNSVRQPTKNRVKQGETTNRLRVGDKCVAIEKRIRIKQESAHEKHNEQVRRRNNNNKKQFSIRQLGTEHEFASIEFVTVCTMRK